MVTVAHRAGLLVRGVGPSVGLGEAVAEALTGREAREVVLLDPLVASEDDRERPELVHGRDERRRDVDAGDLLDDQHRGQSVGTGSAVLLRNVGGVEVGRHERLVGLAGVPSLLVDLGGEGRDLGLGHGPDRLADGLVLLGQHEHVGHGAAPDA